MNLKDYGFSGENIGQNENLTPARIIAVHRDRYRVICNEGETFAILKTREYHFVAEEFPTVGDFVLMIFNPYGESLIVKTLPRTSFFSRKDPDKGRGEQAVAANFDYVFIIQSLNHDFNTKRLERYLTIARQSGALPVVVLTKADLVDDASPYLCAARNCAPDVPVIPISSVSGLGIEDLSEYMKNGCTAVFLGSSGVGKSTLVNRLAGREIMSVNGIREDDSKGRHTTTHRQLIMLDSGAMIIDTPGMRELGMWDISEGLDLAFSDVEAFLGRCRFRDCKHNGEPGCAIQSAIDSGDLSYERWKSYNAIKSEAKYADNKEGYLRQKRQWHKNISKGSKKMKSEGKIRH